MLDRQLCPARSVTPSPVPIAGSAAGPTAVIPTLPNGITADVFYRNACLAIEATSEEIFRVFCYDGEPFSQPQQNPIDKSWVNFGTGPSYAARMRFFKELAEKPFVALRRGTVKGRGWEIKEDKVKQLLTSASAARPSVSLAPYDIKYGIEQKGVDMRIGMDVATLSLKRLVERIILISGDTDMVPAIKLARREGVQVIVIQVGTVRLSAQLIEDADLLRVITPTP